MPRTATHFYLEQSQTGNAHQSANPIEQVSVRTAFMGVGIKAQTQPLLNK